MKDKKITKYVILVITVIVIFFALCIGETAGTTNNLSENSKSESLGVVAEQTMHRFRLDALIFKIIITN